MYRVLRWAVGVFVAIPLIAAAQPSTASALLMSRHGAEATSRSGGAVAARKTLTASPQRNAVTTLVGNALNCTNGPQAGATLRLRDARSGHIVATDVTDEAGLFAFRGVDPGSYIVEIMGSAQKVLAASQILNVNAGETVSGIVKLPCRATALAGLFGQTAQSAVAVTAAAASAAVLGIAATKYTSPQ